MRLRVFSPFGVVLEKEVKKVNLEGLDGFFTFLPRHVDFLSVLPPSIAAYETFEGNVAYLACNRGLVVKCGDEVSLSVHKAIMGTDLNVLTKSIQTEFKQDDEERKELNTVMARLEAGLSRGFMKLGEDARGGI